MSKVKAYLWRCCHDGRIKLWSRIKVSITSWSYWKKKCVVNSRQNNVHDWTKSLRGRRGRRRCCYCHQCCRRRRNFKSKRRAFPTPDVFSGKTSSKISSQLFCLILQALGALGITEKIPISSRINLIDSTKSAQGKRLKEARGTSAACFLSCFYRRPFFFFWDKSRLRLHVTTDSCLLFALLSLCCLRSSTLLLTAGHAEENSIVVGKPTRKKSADTIYFSGEKLEQ